MYGSNGLYIYFTTYPPFGKRFFLPPRGLVLEVFLRKFGLFLTQLMVSCCSYTYVFIRCCGRVMCSCMCPCVVVVVVVSVFPVAWSWSYPLGVGLLASLVAGGVGTLELRVFSDNIYEFNY